MEDGHPDHLTAAPQPKYLPDPSSRSDLSQLRFRCQYAGDSGFRGDLRDFALAANGKDGPHWGMRQADECEQDPDSRDDKNCIFYNLCH